MMMHVFTVPLQQTSCLPLRALQNCALLQSSDEFCPLHSEGAHSREHDDPVIAWQSLFSRRISASASLFSDAVPATGGSHPPTVCRSYSWRWSSAHFSGTAKSHCRVRLTSASNM